jgi:competence protein ComEA
VEVPEGSRAEEALRLVGGMTAEADPFYVNLAETVTDGQKLYFPTLEEAETLEAEVKATAEGLVNINTASAEELCALPGIGASRAADIVRYREQNGAFQTKEDIMKVSGIKQNAYDKLCDKITVQ